MATEPSVGVGDRSGAGKRSVRGESFAFGIRQAQADGATGEVDDESRNAKAFVELVAPRMADRSAGSDDAYRASQPGLPAVFGEFEREILRERVRAGLAHAWEKGKRLGRPRTAARKTGPW